jgi:Tol biopolymer transport system component
MLLLAGTLAAQVTERVDVSSLGAQANLPSGLPGLGDYVSRDGRFVVFTSQASNLVPGDSYTGASDVFIRDRQKGTTECLSVDAHGHPANAGAWLFGLSISTDGRYVAYYAESSNLIPGDTNGVPDVFLRDRLNQTTERVSLASSGAQANGRSEFPAISDDGRYVAFQSEANNLVSGDTNAVLDVFVRDRVNGTTERVSISSGGSQGNAVSGGPTLSADGRLVAFTSLASNLVSGDSNGAADVFVHDRQTGVTERVSVATGGGEGDGQSGVAKICGTGRYVSFTSEATNLVAGDTNTQSDVFVHDLQTGTTVRVSTGSGGTQANSYSTTNSISATGQFVTFTSGATNLIAGTYVPGGVFVRDLLGDSIDVASVSTTGANPNAPVDYPSISADGRFVVFRGAASNLVPGDTNGYVDIFIHDRLATGFTSLCEPGAGGVLPCPCGNPPSGPARGCENSSSTGGASLTASGLAYLSAGSLAFTTSNEKPTALSIVLQGRASIPTGVAFGQGVRCVGGPLLRMFVKTATHGGITAPDLAAGDPTIPARSRALGTLIRAGEEHFYFVYYRDPTVLGGCPSTSTFNSTQTGRVSWWP